MAQTAFPMTGANFVEADWIAFHTDLPGIIGDLSFASFAYGTPTGDTAVIGAGLARVGGYGFRITGTENITVPNAAGTYLIVARYSSSHTGIPGPVRLVCLTGTSYNVLTDLPLHKIVRTAGQTLAQATVTGMRQWGSGGSVFIEPGAPVPTNLPKGVMVTSGIVADVNQWDLDANVGHILHRLDTVNFAVKKAQASADTALARNVAGETALANAAVADGKAVAAQNTANTAVTSNATTAAELEAQIAHVLHRIDTGGYNTKKEAQIAATATAKAQGRQGVVTLTNTGEWPFNTSGATITGHNLTNANYIVTVEVIAADGEPGRIITTDKTASGFKLAYTGGATTVTLRWHVVAE